MIICYTLSLTLTDIVCIAPSPFPDHNLALHLVSLSAIRGTIVVVRGRRRVARSATLDATRLVPPTATASTTPPFLRDLECTRQSI